MIDHRHREAKRFEVRANLVVLGAIGVRETRDVPDNGLCSEQPGGGGCLLASCGCAWAGASIGAPSATKAAAIARRRNGAAAWVRGKRRFEA
ncbi:hypothetical protein [Paraburkholderia bannensis]|uniref:hypothetical protein n=1 Tax=Paraburkholderia bannensis TaxID=765414 RepID=UPI0012EB0D4B|nr:hypothetical protein [Paraburkholderia bannensis]